MNANDDCELLRRYADERDEAAFEEIVRRHIGLVYQAALRQTGDASLAEDVTQAVFTDLARKAGELVERASIVGWLYTSTRFAAANARRGEQRRRAREQEVFVMQKTTTDAAGEATARADWERLRPVIDEALHALDERDREAMLLRFLEGRSLAEVARKLAVKEDTARVRVTRALDKLAGLLSRRGITSTATALSVALGRKAGVEAPTGLARARLKKALEASATSWPLRREKEALICRRSVKSQVSPE
jgi:RNA polymerase sigma factor (sigma-70 family)